jgi:DNA-directed RNA polymerase specialized sigma24 family protein
MDDPPLPPTVADCLLDLAAGDDSARARILELCSERLRLLAHRMLNRFPAVRRWEDTDDVFQNAALRLYRCLGEVSIESPATTPLAYCHWRMSQTAATQLPRQPTPAHPLIAGASFMKQLPSFRPSSGKSSNWSGTSALTSSRLQTCSAVRSAP